MKVWEFEVGKSYTYKNGSTKSEWAVNTEGELCARLGDKLITLDSAYNLICNIEFKEVKPLVGWDKALEHMRAGGEAKISGVKHLDRAVYFFSADMEFPDTLTQTFHARVDNNVVCVGLTDFLLDSKEWELL